MSASKVLAEGGAKNFNDAMVLFRQQIDTEISYLKASGQWNAANKEFWEGHLGVSRRAEKLYDSAMKAALLVTINVLRNTGSTEETMLNKMTNGRMPYSPQEIYNEIAACIERDDFRQLSLDKE